MATGVLIHPLGRETHTLTAEEYENLKACLDILRAPDEDDLAKDVLTAMLPVFGNRQTVSMENILNCLVNWMQQNEQDEYMAKGILFGKGLVRLYGDTEFHRLQNTLTMLRTDAWFVEWFALQMESIADPNLTPEDNRPTPCEMMARLTDCIEEFEQKLKTAREMVSFRSDLFLSEFPAFQEAEERRLHAEKWSRKAPAAEPPFDETAKEEPPAKAQRTRKPPKSAA